MIKHAINHSLALSILQEIHSGNNSLDDLAEVFYMEKDFSQTLSDLNIESNADGIVKLDRPAYTYAIIGTESGVWSVEVHKFLKQHGYLSVLN